MAKSNEVAASTVRAWRWQRQGLDGTLKGASATDVLQRSGWARSVGGVGPYLTMFSRAGITREAADQAVANLEVHELPAARGCTYVLPACDFALGLMVGTDFGFKSEMRVAVKLGVTEKEIDKLCAAVETALKKGPLDPEQIREAVGGATRSLGPEGQKKGVTTTLPLALGKLQQAGTIRRIPANGRLDQQRYRYALWTPHPLAKCKLSLDEAYQELARRFFRWIGPASLAEFQWFSGLGVKASKAVTDGLGLVPLNAGSDALLFANDRDSLLNFKIEKAASIQFVSSLDALLASRRNVSSLLDDADLHVLVQGDKSLTQIGSLSDLSSHAIFDRGRLIGLWEYDYDASSIVWTTFMKPPAAVKAAAVRMEEFIRDNLGDARSFSLDGPKSRAPRIAALRALAAR